jgi:hypothetical protein
MASSKSLRNGGEKEFEELLYSELEKRLDIVDDLLKKDRSLVDLVTPLDFYILVGSMMFFTVWFSVATGSTVYLGLGALIIVLLFFLSRFAWKILMGEEA